MNRVELTGRLTANPELRYDESGKAYTRFTIAVQRNYKNKNGEYDADFFNVVTWDKRAETICKNVKKGHRFGVSGKLKNSKYENKDGETKYITDVILEDFDFLESKEKEDLPAPEYEESYEPNEDDDPFKSFGDSLEVTDDDLPF